MEAITSTRPTSVIDRHLSKIEKEEDGGLGICGCNVPAYCYVILLVLAAFFLTGGTVLTAIAYRPREKEEDAKVFEEREVSSGKYFLDKTRGKWPHRPAACYGKKEQFCFQTAFES